MTSLTKCQWCGNLHESKCPMVKALELHSDGTMKRVEFFAPNDYVPLRGPYLPIDPRLQPPFKIDFGTPYGTAGT